MHMILRGLLHWWWHLTKGICVYDLSKASPDFQISSPWYDFPSRIIMWFANVPTRKGVRGE